MLPGVSKALVKCVKNLAVDKKKKLECNCSCSSKMQHMFLGEKYLSESELFEEARAYSEKTKLPLVEAIRNPDISD